MSHILSPCLLCLPGHEGSHSQAVLPAQSLVQQLFLPLMSFAELINFQTVQNKLQDAATIEKG